ncbi:MAG: hypothetical protein ABEI39_02365, partial [Halobacteriales archaeon]
TGGGGEDAGTVDPEPAAVGAEPTGATTGGGTAGGAGAAGTGGTGGEKNAGLAALASLIVPGAGQIYNG